VRTSVLRLAVQRRSRPRYLLVAGAVRPGAYVGAAAGGAET